jgi:hypothetical protein
MFLAFSLFSISSFNKSKIEHYVSVSDTGAVKQLCLAARYLINTGVEKNEQLLNIRL